LRKITRGNDAAESKSPEPLNEKAPQVRMIPNLISRTRYRSNPVPFQPWLKRAASCVLAALSAIATPQARTQETIPVPGTAEALSQIDGSITAAFRTPNSAVGAGPGISADGRYFAFTTNATNVVPGQNAIGGSPVANLFFRDRVTGTTRLVSKIFGTAATTAGGCSFPSLSRDGRYLTFLSTSTTLVSPGTTGQQVFLYDSETDQVTLVSHAAGSATAAANNTSIQPVMSADGSTIIFSSLATNLVTPFTAAGSFASVYCYRQATGAISLVSAKAGTTTNEGANATVATRSVSTDGRWVVLSTQATNVVSGQTTVSGNSTNVYLADTLGQVPTILCNHAAGSPSTPGNGSTSGSVTGVSFDGKFVAYLSAATNLIPDQTTTNVQVYLYDRENDKNILVSHTAANPLVAANAKGAFSNSNANSLVLSDDGRFCVFSSAATDLLGEYSGAGSQVYLYDRLSGGNTLVSHLATGSSNGSAGTVIDAVISASGQRVLFSSTGGDLIEELLYGILGVANVYAYDNGGEYALRLVSGVELNAFQTAQMAAISPIVTANGEFGVFASASGEFTSLDGNNVADFFGVKLSPIAADPTPVISTVDVPSGSFPANGTLEFTVHWTKPVNITGTPSLSLALGSMQVSAMFEASASTASASVFRYRLQQGDRISNGFSVLSPIVLNGATITDPEGRDAKLTFAETHVDNVRIDNTAPVVASVNTPDKGVYVAGQTLDFTVNFSEPVTVNTQQGTPSLAVTIGNTQREAAYLDGSGTETLVFRYTVQAGEFDNDGVVLAPAISLHEGTLKDAAGNVAELELNNVGFTGGVKVDAIVPTITAVSVPRNGLYAANRDLDVTLTLDKNVTVDTTNGIPGISAKVGTAKRYFVYLSGSGSSTLIFRYTTVAGDNDADGIELGNGLITNSAIFMDTAGNNLNAAFPATVPSTAGVLVDTQSPDAPSPAALVAADDTGALSADRITKLSDLTFTGSAESGTSVKLMIGASEYGPVTAVDGIWSIPVTGLGEGLHFVVATATDAAGNSSDTSIPISVLIDQTAPTTMIGTPSATATGPGPVSVAISYSDDRFDESTLSESNITLNKTGTANGTVTVSGNGSSRTVTISNIVGNGTLGISVAADTASDVAGNPAPAAGPSATFTVVNNRNPIAATDGPLSVIEPNVATLDVLNNDTDDDGDSLTITSVTQGTHGTVSIAADGKSLQFQPQAGYQGSDEFTYTISDGHDGSATGSVTIAISDGGPESYDQSVLLVGGTGTKGDAVEGEEGSTYSSLQFPTINNAGQIAFAATIRGAAQTYRAIVAGAPPVVVARQGEAAPGTEAKFDIFGSPALTEEGKVAFHAHLAGPTIRGTNRSGIWSNIAGHGLELIARYGMSADGLPADARWKSFAALSASDDLIAFTATLVRNNKSVDASNDMGLWIRVHNRTLLVLRKGDVLPISGSPKVASFVALDHTNDAGSHGASVANIAIDAQVKFTDGSTAWVRVAPETAPVVLLRKGDKFDNDSVNAISNPTLGLDGETGTAVLSLASGTGVAVHDDQTVSLAAATGDAISGMKNGVLTSVTAAVSDRATAVGFLGTFKADGLGSAARPALFLSEGGEHQVLAYKGQVTPVGKATWAKFGSFAMPRLLGPLFQAQTASAGKTARSLWATDRSGDLHSLVEVGGNLDVRKSMQKVVSFDAVRLEAVAPMVNRSYNQRRQIVYVAALRDGRTAIVRADIP